MPTPFSAMQNIDILLGSNNKLVLNSGERAAHSQPRVASTMMLSMRHPAPLQQLDSLPR
jgi:hypothetical protein